MLDVEQWAEIRRMHKVEGLSIREIARRSGRDRNTVRADLRSEGPPRYRREPRPSKLDPFKEQIHRLLKDDAALHAGGGRPTEEFAAFCGELPVGWHFCEARDPEAKGIIERHQGFMETNFEPGRAFASAEHFQAELDAWEERVAGRLLRTIRARPAERLTEERERMRPLPERMPETEVRFVMRVPLQPYLRFDTNDYSLDPRFAGRRVEARIGQRQIGAVALDTGEIVASHRRSFAKGLAFTDSTHQALLEKLRGERRAGPEVEVELRSLARYDQLIPA